MHNLKLVLTIALVALSGCSPPSSEGRGIEPPLSWAILPDGSKIAVGPLLPEGTAGSQPVVRCWPQAQGFECLAINGEKFRDVRRFRASELPVRLWEEASPAGYECQITDYMGIGYKETIHGTSGQLQEHMSSNGFGTIEGSWSKKYVEDYWRANGIQPKTLWMNCLALTRIVAPNSNATIGTTDVSPSLLDKGS
ncbi:hypothetical protein [Brevundimonas sp.]|jgi:hypothetical protein|uniref:hypothetical protein n=1 Tax=Brevundimonas sp. TaxID=1871086 RepID=UPI0037BF568F